MTKDKNISLTFDEYSELKSYAMALQAIVDMILRSMDDRDTIGEVKIALSHLKKKMSDSKVL